mmetsp:Transcript_60199/g.99662  ORF Transcript_60199/g.99662 Transcript_60199/m.99662 type:complete len:102 (-) Transcript_60199:273-578(-)
MSVTLFGAGPRHPKAKTRTMSLPKSVRPDIANKRQIRGKLPTAVGWSPLVLKGERLAFNRRQLAVGHRSGPLLLLIGPPLTQGPDTFDGTRQRRGMGKRGG